MSGLIGHTPISVSFQIGQFALLFFYGSRILGLSCWGAEDTGWSCSGGNVDAARPHYRRTLARCRRRRYGARPVVRVARARAPRSFIFIGTLAMCRVSGSNATHKSAVCSKVHTSSPCVPLRTVRGWLATRLVSVRPNKIPRTASYRLRTAPCMSSVRRGPA